MNVKQNGVIVRECKYVEGWEVDVSLASNGMIWSEFNGRFGTKELAMDRAREIARPGTPIHIFTKEEVWQ